ncbi:MAG: hypothetical protein M3P06_00540 [Acidobacteriota bacterium]|nr:hypothetical protein [Acidobacteriota bacterium]
MVRVMFLLAMLVAPILAAEVPIAVPEAEAKLPLFIVHFTTGPAWVEGKPFPEQQHAREHSANLQRLRGRGSILIGARYGETGMVILRAESEESARAEIDQDPAVKSGTFQYTLSELRPFYNGCVP